MDDHPAGVPMQKSSHIVIMILGGILLAIGLGAAYCNYSVREYRDVSRSNSVVVTVATIGEAMRRAHERHGKLCASTNAAVPVDQDPAWKCLAVDSMFLGSTPDFAYSVRTTGDTFTVRAQGKYPDDDERHEYAPATVHF